MPPAFPDDLLQAQIDWYTTYQQLADAPRSRTAELRRNLLRLSAQITRHRFWEDQAHGPAARMALKQAAWSAANG